MEQHSKVGNFGDLLKVLLDEKELSMGELSKKVELINLLYLV